MVVTGLDSSGKPVTIKNSTDTRFFQVLAPTPTPTPEKTPTPTPTQTPTPSQTPFNCECVPSTHTKITMLTNPQVSGGNTYVLPVQSEVGINTNEFANASASTVNLLKPNGDELGMIVFSGLRPDNATIYVREGSNGVCYEGVANSSNGSGETWTVTMNARVLPGDCQPTPTPELEDCCDGLSESTSVGEEIVGKNYIGGVADGVSGKLCWKTLPEPTAAVNLSYSCPLEVSDFSKGGLVITVQSPLTSETNLFRLETDDGKCYEGVLETPGDGINIFKRIK